jgi:hypothetical protein
VPGAGVFKTANRVFSFSMNWLHVSARDALSHAAYHLGLRIQL